MTEEEKDDHHHEPKGHMGWWQVGGRDVGKDKKEKEEKPKAKGAGV